MRLAVHLVAALFAVSAVAGLVVPRGAAGTNVAGGTISQDTMWTLAGSPYYILGDVMVAAPATLSIEPGVTVFFEDNWSLQGNVYANGTAASPIVFTTPTPPSMPNQWGPLALRSGRHFRVSGGSGLDVWGGPIRDCEIAISASGIRLGPDVRGRVENCVVRDVLGDAVALSGTVEFVIANLTIRRVGTALAFLHVGGPETGKSAARNLITHLFVSDASVGVRRFVGAYGVGWANALVHSQFQNVQTLFADPFPGVVHHNTFLRYFSDFAGTGAGGPYDDGEAGNHWDSYEGVDADGDGLGDTPHRLDRYPLVAPAAGAGTYALPPAPPSVESTDPPSGASGVSGRPTVTVLFSETMATMFAPSEVLAATPALHGPPAWATGRAIEVGPADPGSRLIRNTTYALTVAGWLPSLHGVPLGADIVLSFTTRPMPEVVSSSPAPDSEGVSLDVQIVLRFNVPMNTTSVEGALVLPENVPYDVSWSADRQEIRIVLRAPLSPGRVQAITVESSATDDEGMNVPRYQLFFRTAQRVDPWAAGSAGFYGAIVVVVALVAIIAWWRLRPPRTLEP